MRKQREALKHHRDAAIGGLHAADVGAADVDRPGVGGLQTRDHPQDRRLAGARRTEQRHEPPLLHRQRQLLDRGHLAVALGDAGELEEGHALEADPYAYVGIEGGWPAGPEIDGQSEGPVSAAGAAKVDNPSLRACATASSGRCS